MNRFKKGKCILCPPSFDEQYLYAKGMCSMHYWASKKNSKKSLVNQNLNQEDKQELQIWFSYHINNSGFTCENCSEPLFYPNNTIAFSCQAHILPKAIFTSVRSNLNNHLLLGGLSQNCTCHGQFDTNWMNAEKMPVFPIALERFHLFKKEIAKSEYKSLPKIFYDNL